MFGNNEFTSIYASFQAYSPLSHPFSFQVLCATHPHLIWNMPIFYTCKNFSTLRPQQSYTLSTKQEIVEIAQPSHSEFIQKLGKKITQAQRKKRIRNSKKEIVSAKKNSESNIVNQMYSFFSSYDQSERIVQKAIKLLNKNAVQFDQLKNFFYKVIRLINFKRGRKYVNKDSILNYYRPEEFLKQMPNINDKLKDFCLVTLEELCYLFRVITSEYLKNVSMTAILTSKRITNVAQHSHLKRQRKILDSISNISK